MESKKTTGTFSKEERIKFDKFKDNIGPGKYEQDTWTEAQKLKEYTYPSRFFKGIYINLIGIIDDLKPKELNWKKKEKVEDLIKKWKNPENNLMIKRGKNPYSRSMYFFN